MIIRAAEDFDLADIERIVAAAYGQYITRIGKPPGPMLDDYGAHIRNRTIWVADIDGVAAGLIVLIPAEDHLLLDNVAVDPARHGSGIGRALLAFADRRGRACGELRLYTHLMMTENIAMYRALGWQETGRGEQDGYQRVFFRKTLS